MKMKISFSSIKSRDKFMKEFYKTNYYYDCTTLHASGKYDFFIEFEDEKQELGTKIRMFLRDMEISYYTLYEVVETLKLIEIGMGIRKQKRGDL